MKNSKIFFLGVFVFLIPFLGLPLFWKSFLTSIFGLTLALLSVDFRLKQRWGSLSKIDLHQIQADFLKENTKNSILDYDEKIEAEKKIRKIRKKREKSITDDILDENQKNISVVGGQNISEYIEVDGTENEDTRTNV